MKVLRITGLLILAVLIWSAVNQYFFCPYFSFPQPSPFSGTQLYNPYQDTDSSSWLKCNFHAHSNAWYGLTNGKGIPEDIRKVYDSLGYDIGLVSDYHKIDVSNKDDPGYIPVYEHGYNVKKSHHLVIGSNNVLWLDYLFPQTRSNKQHLLNLLSEDTAALIVINHPNARNGFTREDLQYLSNYHCIEVMSRTATSFAEWDAALSAGKPVFLAANDDTHNIFLLQHIGQHCTWVNAASADQTSVINAMKKGCSYGMKTGYVNGETLSERINRLKYKLPRLKMLTVKKDTIEVSVSEEAKEIVFTGKGGKELSKTTNTHVAQYIMQPEDEYARASAYFGNGTEIYLNPVYYYNTDPFAEAHASLNKPRTILFRIAGIIILLLWVLLLFRFLLSAKSRQAIQSFLSNSKKNG